MLQILRSWSPVLFKVLRSKAFGWCRLTIILTQTPFGSFPPLPYFPPPICYQSRLSVSGVFWATEKSTQTCLSEREFTGWVVGKSSLVLFRGSNDVLVNLVFSQICFPLWAVSSGRLFPCRHPNTPGLATCPLSSQDNQSCFFRVT